MEELSTVTIDAGISWGTKILISLAIMIAAWVIGKWLQNRVASAKRLDATLSSFLGGFAKYVVLALAVIMVLGQFGVQTASLLAVLGAAGLAIALALQGTLGNVASGLMLLLIRPFSVDEVIHVSGLFVKIRSLGLFGTECTTVDGVDVFIPNSQIWNGEIQNYSRAVERRQDLDVGIGYDDNIDTAIKLIQKIVDKQDSILKAEGKEPVIFVKAFGASSVDLVVRFWCEPADFIGAKSDLFRSIKTAFDKEGITIPYPIRTLEMADDQTPPAKETKPKKSSSKKSSSSSSKKKAA